MIRARVDNELLPLANYCRLTLRLLLIVQDLTHTKIPVKSNNLMDIKLYIYLNLIYCKPFINCQKVIHYETSKAFVVLIRNYVWML